MTIHKACSATLLSCCQQVERKRFAASLTELCLPLLMRKFTISGLPALIFFTPDAGMISGGMSFSGDGLYDLDSITTGGLKSKPLCCCLLLSHANCKRKRTVMRQLTRFLISKNVRRGKVLTKYKVYNERKMDYSATQRLQA